MENLTLLDRIRALAQKIEVRAKAAHDTGDGLSRLELDLLMRDTRQLYDLMLALTPREVAPETPSAAAPPENAEEASTGQMPDEPETTPAAEVETASPAGEDVPAEAQATGGSAIEAESGKGETKPAQPDKKAKAGAQAPTLFDEAPSGESVHDKLVRAREGKSLADKLSSRPAADLKKSIGINEKFKFVNDLFDGNLQEYNTCIGHLNEAVSFAEAEAYLEEVVVRKYETDKSSESYQSLLRLLERKFNRQAVS